MIVKEMKFTPKRLLSLLLTIVMLLGMLPTVALAKKEELGTESVTLYADNWTGNESKELGRIATEYRNYELKESWMVIIVSLNSFTPTTVHPGTEVSVPLQIYTGYTSQLSNENGEYDVKATGSEETHILGRYAYSEGLAQDNTEYTSVKARAGIDGKISFAINLKAKIVEDSGSLTNEKTKTINVIRKRQPQQARTFTSSPPRSRLRSSFLRWKANAAAQLRTTPAIRRT